MPRLSEFFGIIISIYWGDTGLHNAPHFHARYAEFEAVFSIPVPTCSPGTSLAASVGSSRHGQRCTPTSWNGRGRW